MDAAQPAAEAIAGLGLTEQDVVDAYIYVLARYLVIRQERIDIAEEGVDYNVIKFNELGKAEFVNPNLDVAYLEAWFAIDERTPVILEIPAVMGRYYTAQIVDEWADVLCNVNERTFPTRPHGRFALCLKGSHPTLPDGAQRIDLPSKKAGALALQHAFRIVPAGKPTIEPAVEVPLFTNAAPITVDAFAQPMLAQVLDSAPDAMALSPGMRARAEAIADYVTKDAAHRTAIDTVIKQKALPALVAFIRSYGDKRGGWIATTGKPTGFGEDYWFRTAANYAGIWWNNNQEVVYFIGEKDASGVPLNGDSPYRLHFAEADLPQRHVNAYWSLTLMSLPDYRVVPNGLERYSFNNLSQFAYEPDGSLDLYLSAERPSQAPESNWLPSPAGKPFTLNMRLYVPKPEVLSGAYYVPPIERVN
jgi:hypothetical protein